MEPVDSKRDHFGNQPDDPVATLGDTHTTKFFWR